MGVTVLTALGDNDWLGDAVSVILNNAVFVFEAVCDEESDGVLLVNEDTLVDSDTVGVLELLLLAEGDGLPDSVFELVLLAVCDTETVDVLEPVVLAV